MKPCICGIGGQACGVRRICGGPGPFRPRSTCEPPALSAPPAPPCRARRRRCRRRRQRRRLKVTPLNSGCVSMSIDTRRFVSTMVMDFLVKYDGDGFHHHGVGVVDVASSSSCAATPLPPPPRRRRRRHRRRQPTKGDAAEQWMHADLGRSGYLI